jgi:formate hydrogenlyase regulatory protein HycA
MGFVVATPSAEKRTEGWHKGMWWYAVLHKFNADGKHIATDHWFAGTTADGGANVTSRAQATLDQMLESLGGYKFDNVVVRLFEVEIDGHIFGRIPVIEPEKDYESVHLEPNDLAFFEPWNGIYDT